MLARPLLGADLADSLVTPGRGDHGPALADVVGDGLLAVDVLLGHAGEDERDGVPVIGRADDDGVNVFPIEDRAKVDARLRLLAGLPLDPLGRPVGVPLIDVGEGGDRDLGSLHEDVEVVGSLSAAADEGHPDRFARRHRLARHGANGRVQARPGGGRRGRDRGSSRGFHEAAPVQSIGHRCLRGACALGSRARRGGWCPLPSVLMSPGGPGQVVRRPCLPLSVPIRLALAVERPNMKAAAPRCRARPSREERS